MSLPCLKPKREGQFGLSSLSKYTKSFALEDGRAVLYHALTGAIDIVDVDLLSGEFDLDDAVNSELQAFLLERGYLVDNPESDEKRFNALYSSYTKHKEEVRPLIFQLVLTYNCNLGCEYCFQNSVKELKRSLKPAEVEHLFSAIEEIRSFHPKTRTKPVIALFGGEPLLGRNVSLVRRIYEEVAKRGWVNGPIISNGVALDKFLPLFKEYRPSGIQMTIDGPEQIHNERRDFHGGGGTFKKIVENIDLALDAGLKIGIRSNIDEVTVESISDLVPLARSHGWLNNKNVELNIAPIHERACGSSSENKIHDVILKRLLELTLEYPELRNWHLDGWPVVNYFSRMLDDDRAVLPRFDHCEAIVGKTFYLDPYGDIYTCIEACGMREYAVGQYMPSVEFNQLFDRFLGRNVKTMESCSSCGFSMMCGGGCALSSMLDGHELEAPHCANTDSDMKQCVEFRFKE